MSVTLSGADLAGTYAVTVHYASGPTASVDVAPTVSPQVPHLR